MTVGSVITIATGIQGPWGLALDNSEGNVYVVGSTSNAIFKVPLSANDASYPIVVTSSNIIAGSTSGSVFFFFLQCMSAKIDYIVFILIFLMLL